MNTLLKILSFYFNILTRISPELSAKHAFNLFAYPFSSKLKPKQNEFLATASQFSVDVEGRKVQCYSWGTGKETVLLAHGWQSNSYRWKPYIDSLDKSKYTLYAFDAPGHGNSQGKICTIPLYEKSIESIINKRGDIDHFIGHSIGSFACASFLFHHNYKIKSYVSLASPLGAPEFIEDFKSKISVSDRSLEYLLKHFESYTNHPVEHYSQEVFSSGINAEKILIIHDKDDEATPHSNAIKAYNIFKNNNQNVELILTEGYRHRLKDPSIVKRVVECLEKQVESLSAPVSC